LNDVLTDAAETDLRAIIRYTHAQWGAAQVHRYVATLKTGINHVVAGKGAFKEMDTLHPGLRVAHCGHHYIFCLPREDAPALIVAILHERMDLIARIADRLS